MATRLAAATRPGREVTLARRLPLFAWRPTVAVVIDAALLTTDVTQRGYHRNELYFRMLAAHPTWRYVDQAPFTRCW